MVLDELSMRLDRVGRDTHDLGAGRSVILPAIAQRTHLTGAHGSLVAGVEQQDNDMAPPARQSPFSRIGRLKGKVRRFRSDPILV